MGCCREYLLFDEEAGKSRGASAEHLWSICGASLEHPRSMQGACREDELPYFACEGHHDLLGLFGCQLSFAQHSLRNLQQVDTH